MRKAALAAMVVVLGGCAGGGAPRPTIDLSRTEPAAETYTDDDLAHLRFLLTPEQAEEYLALPAGPARAELMRVRWEELDPTPTTPENELRDDHYRRLAYAREHFAIDEAPGWDRRGELLLRYGPPDQRETTPADVVEGQGLVPPREIWVYRALGQAYRLEDPRFQGNFRDYYELADSRDRLTPRDIDASRDQLRTFVDPDKGLGRRGLDDIPDAEAELQAQRLETMLVRGQEAYREKPQSYRHDYGGEELEFVFDVVNFGGGAEGRSQVEVNTAFWAGDLQYRAAGAAYVAVLETDAVFKTLDYHDVARRERITHDRKETVNELEGKLVLDQLSLNLLPGTYRLALSVRDSLSGNVGIYKTEVTVSDLAGDGVHLSDIQRALDVRSGQPGDEFVRGRYQVVPYPLGTFPRDHDIYLYFEAYGLELSPTGDCLYAVDVLIQPRTPVAGSWFGSSKGRVVPGVASTFEGSGRSSTVQEYIIFDPSTFTDDVYDIEITVHDRVGSGSAKGSVSFAVQSR
jgi:GWxTD domain-containing protein